MEVFHTAEHALQRYFQGEPLAFCDLNYQMQGTPFQKQVWELLLTIPFGSTTTYRTLADTLGKPKAARAVAYAIGRNPLLLIVPCHRVIGSDHTLRGYAAGVALKAKLLAHEGAMPTRGSSAI